MRYLWNIQVKMCKIESGRHRFEQYLGLSMYLWKEGREGGRKGNEGKEIRTRRKKGKEGRGRRKEGREGGKGRRKEGQEGRKEGRREGKGKRRKKEIGRKGERESKRDGGWDLQLRHHPHVGRRVREQV